MLEFHPITLEDRAWIVPLVWQEGSSSADFGFGNIFMWDTSFHQLVTRSGDRVVMLLCYKEEPFFVWPVGAGPVEPVLKEMRAYAAAQGFPFVVCGVTREHLPLLEQTMGEGCQVTPDRCYWDYLYSAEKLATLSGKKLHGKRNHINRFESEYDWSFSAMTPADFPECRAFLEDWLRSYESEGVPEGIENEHAAILRGFDHFDALGLDGGVLRVEGKVVAFTIGERLCEHTVVVHFEKADVDYNGAYTMINREFVRLLREKYPEVQWINREDDMGQENLRRAKESYYPEAFVEKYTAQWS